MPPDMRLRILLPPLLALTFATTLMAQDKTGAAAPTTQPSFLAPDAELVKLAGDLKFIEGPVWMPRGFLVFSDIPPEHLMRWDESAGGLSTFREVSHGANGNTLDREGRLISCEHTSRRVTRTETDGTITVLGDRFDGKRFNSPNDVVVKSDGTIWFTDPPYGLPKGEQRELDKNYVFRLDPETKQVASVGHDQEMPNGLCFSPDEKRLYVADSGKPRDVWAYDVGADNGLSNGRVFCKIDKGGPDGMRCDVDGNLWSSAGDGVHVFSPDGKLLGKIPVPETPANLCFGGADGKTLFITARTSLYCIRTKTTGGGVATKRGAGGGH
jgi:gluconolactonase